MSSTYNEINAGDGIAPAPIGKDLNDKKAIKHQEIDEKTQQLLENGSFTYNTKEFRLTDRAILKWVGVSNADLKNLIVFPYVVTTKTYEPYSITSKSDWTALFETGLTTVEAIEGGGRSYHILINAADTKEELDLIVDNR
jgi:hypothetical protein